MSDRFVVTGSGRCGTNYMSVLLTAAGVPCGHERVYGYERRQWDDLAGDSSWMVAAYLPVAEAVVLLVRHPMDVVRSFVEIGFFILSNPIHDRYHAVLRRVAPAVYEWATPQDRALATWCELNERILPHAEVVLRLESFGQAHLTRLLRWSGHDGDPTVFRSVAPTNRHEALRNMVNIRHVPSWSRHDPDLVDRAKSLCRLLGYPT